MIIDLRTYTIRIGAMGEFLAKYARDGLPVQGEHLGAPMGYCTTETGELSQVVHFWQYADLADRERRRAALEADPRWRAYRNGSASLVLRQESRLLRGVDLAALAAPAPA
ncbi:MAG: family containing protein [Ramlibacter sp.]|jgi:hypothetical protein|uniref:NIPSNAP family protein n=1 Tax=Ramlibacter sp. TaxID=1917967 RepID=UPI002629791D|nr:NIPSNAP family protein [Ramlibacter sp.]MDB5751580.1 family containing protein [Ramlibacter sp.]